ncbi:hypothetical protein C1I93_16785, partial [Micromonospora endophytica]
MSNDEETVVRERLRRLMAGARPDHADVPPPPAADPARPSLMDWPTVLLPIRTDGDPRPATDPPDLAAGARLAEGPPGLVAGSRPGRIEPGQAVGTPLVEAEAGGGGVAVEPEAVPVSRL